MSNTRHYIPSAEPSLVPWIKNLSLKLELAPAEYGTTAEQASIFSGVVADFIAAYDVAVDPTTRTKPTVEVKNEKKATMIAATRDMVRNLQVWSGMTNAKRDALGIPTRDNQPTPTPIPQSAPEVTIKSVQGRLFNLELREVGSESKAKPTGVRSAWVYYYIGEEMPANFGQMGFCGSATRADTQVVIPPPIGTGVKVWLSACWVNRADKCGPVSQPIFSWTTQGTMQNAA